MRICQAIDANLSLVRNTSKVKCYLLVQRDYSFFVVGNWKYTPRRLFSPCGNDCIRLLLVYQRLLFRIRGRLVAPAKREKEYGLVFYFLNRSNVDAIFQHKSNLFVLYHSLLHLISNYCR